LWAQALKQALIPSGVQKSNNLNHRASGQIPLYTNFLLKYIK
jgi:hypothetical protein